MKDNIRLKKSLGQHFLKDEEISKKIFEEIKKLDNKIIIEIGPGDGALTKYLYPFFKEKLCLVEIDSDMIKILKKRFPDLSSNIVKADFLKFNLENQFKEKINIVGNFPYNISTQIFYKILENKDKINNIICMIQKEVAQRISASPGSKAYGIPSVLIQAFYDVEYLFEVPPEAFLPPPKVTSAVIRLKRNLRTKLRCDEKKFKNIVKLAFNQRRKTLRNALKSILPKNKDFNLPILNKRAEELSVKDFEELIFNKLK